MVSGSAVKSFGTWMKLIGCYEILSYLVTFHEIHVLCGNKRRAVFLPKFDRVYFHLVSYWIRSSTLIFRTCSKFVICCWSQWIWLVMVERSWNESRRLSTHWTRLFEILNWSWKLQKDTVLKAINKYLFVENFYFCTHIHFALVCFLVVVVCNTTLWPYMCGRV